ncbi:MAG: hybrid sensor histidine kinase/response regulator [Deltaproteobacteria bacterium]|nr:hybrid sensor histidine kinase/response regulator [Deltaproteobacteria bacterium]
MKNTVSHKLLYTGLLRFLLVLFSATLLPLLLVKAVLIFFPLEIHNMINIFILMGVSLCLIGSCFYVLTQYQSVDKALEPVVRMAEVGEMASRVAHDLRGPLSGVQAVLNHLHDLPVKDQGILNHLNLLELSSRRLENIAEDLLKKHRGQDEEKRDFDLHQILDELAGEYASQPDLSNVKFVKNYAQEAIVVTGERNKISRVFGNIIKNAIEAMALKGTISLTTRIVDNHVKIAIGDTGPGMSPEVIKRVLSEQYTGGKKGGNGIGLVFVREVLASHEGQLHIDSKLNEGSVFHIELPLARLDAVFEMTLEQGKPVLVMDDDASMQEQWLLLLKKQNWKIVLSDSWENFVGMNIQPNTVGGCVIDYHFENSELNGLQIIRKLKEQGFTNLYLCTAEYWKPSIQKEAKELGVTICPKPLPKIVIAEGVIARPEGPKQSREIIGIASSPLAPRNDKAGYTVLVIDDDAVIRMGWSLMKEKLHIATLHCFASLEELQKQPVDLSSIDIAFVDKNIDGSSFNGAAVLNHLKSNGVSKIVLASGEREEDLKADPQFALADFVVNAKIPRSFKEFFS